MEEENKNTPEEIVPPVITKKDPKRVEQGKRLAAISKEAKEKKMREKIREEEFSYLPYIVYPLAFLSSAGLMYLLLFGGEKREAQDIHPMTIIREKKVDSPKKKFETLN